jgi:hypothetical protein
VQFAQTSSVKFKKVVIALNPWVAVCLEGTIQSCLWSWVPPWVRLWASSTPVQPQAHWKVRTSACPVWVCRVRCPLGWLVLLCGVHISIRPAGAPDCSTASLLSVILIIDEGQMC